jgi:hypothetical protein
VVTGGGRTRHGGVSRVTVCGVSRTRERSGERERVKAVFKFGSLCPFCPFSYFFFSVFLFFFPSKKKSFGPSPGKCPGWPGHKTAPDYMRYGWTYWRKNQIIFKIHSNRIELNCLSFELN